VDTVKFMRGCVYFGGLFWILCSASVVATPNWSSYSFDLVSSNMFACGHYVYSHTTSGGKGVYGNGYGFSLTWCAQAPDTNCYWWIKGDVSGFYECLGAGLFPEGYDHQENNVSSRPGGSTAATREPVNVITGGMFLDEQELVLPAAGLGLVWNRAYNSVMESNHGLGFGWRHSLDWSVTPTTNVYIHGSFTNATPALLLQIGTSEARSLLQEEGANIWRSKQAPPLTVYGTSNGEYTLVLPAGNSCQFGTNGLVRSISNAWNNALSFTYTNIAGTTVLRSVAHSDGRALAFMYQSNLLVRIDTPSTNLCYLYSYNDAGELTGAVTRSSSGDFLTTYAYDSNGVHAMLQHRNARGDVATYAYQTNTSGQVTPQCIQVRVATNYYEHSISYATGKTIVTYARGDTNAVYDYYHDSNANSLQISRIEGPSDTSLTRLLTHDPVLLTTTSDATGYWQKSPDIHWDRMRFYVNNEGNGASSGHYDFKQTENDKAIYTNANGRILQWYKNNRWEIWSSGGSMDYFMSNGGAMPDDGNGFGSWRWYYDSNAVNLAITRYESVTNDGYWIEAPTAARYTYDSAGNLIQYQTAANSNSAWSFTWDTNWALCISATDPEGHRAEWDYTNGSVSVERFFPATNQPVETRYAYTGNGRLAGVTNGNGSWAQFLYDSYGYPTQTLSASGMTNWMTWNVLGHLTALTLPSHLTDTNSPPNMIPRVITFDSNELGWVNKITYPDDSLETFLFDGIGNLTNHIDTAGRTNSFAWLPTRKLASATRFLITGGSNQEARVSMAYDQQMNVLNIKDELNRAVEGYKLDLQDRPVSITNVEGQVMSLSWGVGTMLKGMARFDGSSLDFSYDEEARLRLAAFPDESLSLGYYKNGLLMTASNRWGIISNAFDGANRLTAQTQPVPAGHLAYTYYPAGQVSNVMSAAGTNTYTLDAGDRLQSIAVSGPDLRKDSFTYTHDTVNGLVSGMSASNGLKCAYAYDVMDRLTGISWSDASNRVLRSRSFTYTPAGLISNITFETGEKALYSYDSLDRLTREKHTDYYGQVISDETYEYDLAGNRTKKVVLDANGSTLLTLNYSLPVANKLGSWTVPETNLATRFSVVGSSADPIGVGIRYGTLWVSNSPSAYVTPYVASTTNFYAFDLICGMGTQYIHAAIRDMAGNTSYVTNRFYPTCITNGTYQYSAAGCLTNREYSGKDYSDTLGLTWNGQYQLTSATTNGALAEAYGYDGLGRRVFIAEGGVTNWMVYDGNQVVAEVDGSGQLKKTYVYEGLDRAVSMTTYGAATNTFYFIRDHLGSTLALTDESGNIVESYRYDAWGRVLGVYNASGAQIENSAVGNRILWQGREYSWAAKLYNFRARWYDPVTGRWLSNDPIGISGGLNQYVFCANNPVNFRDPLGLCTEGSEESSFMAWLHGILDAGGTVEPTPFCDLSNALIYSVQGQWGNAGISVAGVIPYIGDVGKAGKYGSKVFKAGNKLAKKQVHSVGQELGISGVARKEFGAFIEKTKRMEGRGGADNFTYEELRQLGKEFLGQ
jgi:RHS repeat-associated protein